MLAKPKALSNSFIPKALANSGVGSFSFSFFDLYLFCWQTLLTVFEGREGTKFSDGDVLIFPEMIKYR